MKYLILLGALTASMAAQADVRMLLPVRLARVDLVHNRITIGERTLVLPADVQVYTASGQPLPRTSLKAGERVRLGVSRRHSGAQQPALQAIYILPSALRSHR